MIKGHLNPYSHIPGVKSCLPGSFLSIQVFPALLRVESLHEQDSLHDVEIMLGVKGPVKDFTVQQDLEGACLRVWGKTAEGYLRYRVHSIKAGNGFVLVLEKVPQGGGVFTASSLSLSKLSSKGEVSKRAKSQLAYAKDVIYFSHTDIKNEQEFWVNPSKERLSLGNHKAQDWDMVLRRQKVQEILPAWLSLGQMLPRQMFKTKREGTAELFDICEQYLLLKKHENLSEAFLNVLITGFEGILTPRLEDRSYHGLVSSPISSKQSPLRLLQEGAALIKRLFIHVIDEKTIDILPSLPPEIHCGRYINISCGDLGVMDLEWSKKTVRRISFEAKTKGAILFLFHRNVKSYRLRKSDKDHGYRVKCGKMLACEQGERYLLDNFKK